MSERPQVDDSTYDEARREIRTALQETLDEIEAHELVCHQLYERFEHYSWVGVYVVVGGRLILSAWEGPEETEHTTIEIGAGICGLAAETGRTEVVPDVSRRPEFIACFPTTKSEIVVPIRSGGDPGSGVIGEIDIDSDWLDAFDERDRALLETLAADLAGVMAGS